MKQPVSPAKAPKEAESLGPGEYHLEEVADLNQWRKSELQEYTRQLAAQRHENHELVRQRRDVLEKMKQSFLQMEQSDKDDRAMMQLKYAKNKHPFNSTGDRLHDRSLELADGSQGPGPGSYNPIAETIMGRYIKRQMQREKLQVASVSPQKPQPEQEWRVYNRVLLTGTSTSDSSKYYDLPGAFDETVKKAKRSHFTNKALKYPPSFGGSARRFA